MAGHRERRERAGVRAHRIGQDAGRLPVGPRPPGGRSEPRAPGLRLAAEGPLLRRREEPARAAQGHRRRHLGGHSHRRHAAEGAPGHAAHAARRAHHHARVALPDAHLEGARVPGRYRLGDRGRDPRRGAHQARRSSRADAGAPRARGRPASCSASGCRPPSARSRRSDGFSWAPAASAGSWTPACASRSTCRSWCRWRTCASPTVGEGEALQEIVGDSAATSRSIWPAIYPELLELVKQHRSTIIFVNSRRGAERLAVRLNELASEGGMSRSTWPAPTTARWRVRSAWWSRTCSSRASCPAWSPPRRSSWASTWARSTS